MACFDLTKFLNNILYPIVTFNSESQLLFVKPNQIKLVSFKLSKYAHHYCALITTNDTCFVYNLFGGSDNGSLFITEHLIQDFNVDIMDYMVKPTRRLANKLFDLPQLTSRDRLTDINISTANINIYDLESVILQYLKQVVMPKYKNRKEYAHMLDVYNTYA